MRVVVLGTGRMAAGIAAAAAGGAHPTTVVGRTEEKARQTAARAGRPVESGPLDGSTIGAADLVIETIVEDVEVKMDVLRRVGELGGPEMLVATNTSSLSLTELSSALERPDRFLGLHFLNPADRTCLVEVAGGAATSAGTLDAGCAFVESIGKHPIRVNAEVNGFVWNRIQFAVFRECLSLLENGVADAVDIDLAVSAGLAPRWMAIGPLGTADLGGLDTFARVSGQLFPDLSTASEPPKLDGAALHPLTDADRVQVLELREQMLEIAARTVGTKPVR
ncbi:3-hydroxyacyl-CoA dehydrogenase family protein [Amycolatopsis jejuensis]|uniref:3-hydroxyacyl-CoA dehydrogenase family protein n=1 Tax=Amycolatopsis jejuensis TaxID=330084 RepID=UPI000A020FD9|nr:3-hydroxyacyl-CoA dehydrogenase NAD-binding domain-containing protein [Amycolatopsis jejuensis]